MSDETQTHDSLCGGRIGMDAIVFLFCEVQKLVALVLPEKN